MSLIVSVLCGAVVIYASFCRLTKTNSRTKTSVRFAVWCVASVSVLIVIAPLLTSWRPDAAHAALMAAVALYQWSLRRTWQHGVPHSFQRSLA